LADVLHQQGHHLQAQAIYQRLLAVKGGDLRIALQLAHGSLWNRNYQEALDRFQAILDRDQGGDLLQKHPQLPRAYINPAAAAPDGGKAQRRVVLSLYERVLTGGETDASYLTRLGWVLHRLDENEKSAAVLERAAALAPAEPAQRRQLAA